MNSLNKKYKIEEDILLSFKLTSPPSSKDIDIDGLVEDLCIATDIDQIHMIGIFLYLYIQGDPRCMDPFNLSFFSYSLLPLPENTGIYFKQDRIRFLQTFTLSQIRLILFIFMHSARNSVDEIEKLEFIEFWANKFIDRMLEQQGA